MFELQVFWILILFLSKLLFWFLVFPVVVGYFPLCVLHCMTPAPNTHQEMFTGFPPCSNWQRTWLQLFLHPDECYHIKVCDTYWNVIWMNCGSSAENVLTTISFLTFVEAQGHLTEGNNQELRGQKDGPAHCFHHGLKSKDDGGRSQHLVLRLVTMVCIYN